MKLLLGSNSPRRNQLLKEMGYAFTKVTIDCDEDFDEAMPSEEVPRYLAGKKSDAYTDLKSGELLITADTVVVANGGHILNKPLDKEHAERMMYSLSDETHKVITGVCLRSIDKKIIFSETTEVMVDGLTTDEIEYYLERFKPYDKAGAYGIQEWFGLTRVRGINGCYYNVVGLPCNALYDHLVNAFGIGVT